MHALSPFLRPARLAALVSLAPAHPMLAVSVARSGQIVARSPGGVVVHRAHLHGAGFGLPDAGEAEALVADLRAAGIEAKLVRAR